MNDFLFAIVILIGFYFVFFFCIWLRFKLHKKHVWCTRPFQTRKELETKTVLQVCKVCGKCRTIKESKYYR